MSALAPVFAVALFGLGASVHELCRPAGAPVVISLRTLFHALVAGIICVSLLAVLLLEASAFHAGTLTALAAGLAVGGAVIVRLRRAPSADSQRSAVRVRVGAGRAHLALGLILVGAAWLRLPPSNWVIGGQDQGVYVNVASSIRQTGTVFLHDDLLPVVEHDAAARDYYLRHSYLHTAFASASCNEGVYTPGVFVQNLAHGVLVPQFYHLYPLWLAISQSLFGAALPTLPLPAFALLSVVLIYRLTHELAGDTFAALAAALLLAVNPVHSYMAKFPVSEVPTAFFFLAGVYFLVRLLKGAGTHRFNGSMTVLAFACLFFTRVTGFLYLPVLFAFLGYGLIVVASATRRRGLTICCAGIGAAYAYSVLHGYVFSCAYAQTVHLAYLGSDFSTWAPRAVAAGVAVLMVAAILVLRRYHRPLRRAAARLQPHRDRLAMLLLAAVLGWSALIAYRFASTPARYAPELESIGIDPATSPKIAGLDEVALATLNDTVLVLLLTPVAVLCAIYGAFRLLRRWPSQPQLVLCGALAVYFFGVNTIANVNARYLYFYARYLLSETIPLLLICAGVGLGLLYRRAPRAALAVLLLAAGPSLALSYLHTRDTEMKHVYGDLAGIAAAMDDRSIVLIDREILPDWRRLGAPLKLSFGLDPFWFDRADLEQGRLDGVLGTLAASRRPLYAIANDDGLASQYFAPDRTLPLRLNVFLAKWMSLPVGFLTERDTTVTVYRSTSRLRALAPPPQGNTAWDGQ